jgi:Protein of unknown function (DUF4435)
VTLARKAVGLTNKPKFHDVDAIVYVEGGAHTVAASGLPPVSIDVPFWRAIFSTYKPVLKIRLEPKGGKQNLTPLLEEIIRNNITNSFVALDADFDVLFGIYTDHRQALYTYGYSCENDLFSTEVLAEVFLALCHICETEIDLGAHVDEVISDLRRSLRHIVRSDALASAISATVIPRDSPGRVVRQVNGKMVPEVDVKSLRITLRHINSSRDARFSPRVRLDVDGIRHCFGHLVDLIMCATIRRLVTLFGVAQHLDDHAIRSMAVEKFANFLQSHTSSAIAQHYASQFERLTPPCMSDPEMERTVVA